MEVRVSSYRGTADRPDKAKAIAAVIAIHVLLALLILSGLSVRMVTRAVDQMTTINISEPAPPPVRRRISAPRVAARPQAMKKLAGRAARNADSAAIVAPDSRPLPSPVPTARVAGTGSLPNAGTALAGSGTGGGNSGTGSGAGGAADYSRFTPARLVENIPNSEYRELAATGIPSGLVGVLILVSASGTVSNCRIARSSGDPAIDSLVCQLTVRYVRFDPARDSYGRAVAQDITYFPSWRRR